MQYPFLCADTISKPIMRSTYCTNILPAEWKYTKETVKSFFLTESFANMSYIVKSELKLIHYYLWQVMFVIFFLIEY
jgi:hypothetical protein